MSHSRLPSFLTSLPVELVTHIFSVLPKEMLLQLRLLNHHFEAIATPLAFQSLRLEAYEESPIHFIRIAKSEKLRGLVQELTCDTWVGIDSEVRFSDDYEIPCDFLRALAYLRYLKHLKALHLRFNQDCACHGLDGANDNESPTFRFRVLDTVFGCLAGTWSVDKQKEFDEEWDLETEYPEEECQCHRQATVDSISLITLTVSNLAAYDMSELSESEAFKSVMASPTLIDLKIYVTVETEGFDREYCSGDPERYEFYNNLTSTWLSPPVAANLQELSLYCHENWGWYPKLDFRTIGGGNGLPNLKVLALGKFVFSHEWQIDWIASLGLKELYLDNCAILIQVEINEGALDTPSQVVGQDAGGHDIYISNTGYLPKDWHEDNSRNGNYTITQFPLRWHVIFNRWRESLTTLRVFKVGLGEWRGAPNETQLANRSLFRRNANGEPDFLWDHQFEHNAFRYFKCPPPGGSGEKYRHGTGMSDTANFRYVYYNLYEWTEWESDTDYMIKSEDPRWILEHDIDAKDLEALNLLRCKIQSQKAQSSISK